MIWRLIPFLCLLFVAVEIRGQEFSLEEALGDTTEGNNVVTMKPSPAPQPANPGTGGGNFDDSDLFDGNIHDTHPNEGDTHGDGQENKGEEKTSLIAGIASTVGVAALGAITSFIAYQKKKLCFKGAGDDPENVNMENQNRDPQVQSSLLSKS
ncbi:CD99 antigen-like [Spea bombifrons]|uniref:CD99 antigen-like n=1 Tax=Spea bombifrons TaxID=233779 RepID=UPI002348FE4D|nr:CD99 antigen-like [Spea bombifrons]